MSKVGTLVMGTSGERVDQTALNAIVEATNRKEPVYMLHNGILVVVTLDHTIAEVCDEWERARL